MLISTTVTSYGYQIISTSAKLTTLKEQFCDISENVYMAIVEVKQLMAVEGAYKTPIFSESDVGHSYNS